MNMKTSELIRNNALKYERFKCQLGNIPSNEIEQFRSEVEQAFNRIPVKIELADGQPYDNLEQLTQGINDTGIMVISTDFNESALLPDLLNLKFRAVHDFLHYYLQEPFGFKGELNVYKAQKFIHKSDIGKRMLYSEIVLQASYFEYFGNFPLNQKVII